MGFLSLPVTLEINYYKLQLTILTLGFGCKTGKILWKFIIIHHFWQLSGTG
jgi:hypothetical protein